MQYQLVSMNYYVNARVGSTSLNHRPHVPGLIRKICAVRNALVTPTNAQALKEMMAFALEQQGKGTEISQEDVQDVGEAGHALVESLDNFVSLAPPTDVKLIEKLVSDSSPK